VPVVGTLPFVPAKAAVDLRANPPNNNGAWNITISTVLVGPCARTMSMALLYALAVHVLRNAQLLTATLVSLAAATAATAADVVLYL